MNHTLLEAIAQGKAKYSEAKKCKLNRLLLKPITPRIFIIIFNKSFFDEGFGLPAQISRKDIGMLNHWILHLKTNLSSKSIATIAKDIPMRWRDYFAGVEFNTVEGKKLTFPTRPNLRTVLYCKNDVASFLLEDNIKGGVGVGKPIIPK